jgi:hypothetical protein
VFVEVVGDESIALGLAVVALLLRPKLVPSELARIRVAIRRQLIKHFRLCNTFPQLSKLNPKATHLPFDFEMITSSGRHIQIVEKRFCSKCNTFTDQVCHKVRYQENEEKIGTLIKRSNWVCPTCLTDTEDVKVQPLPCDKVRIINRILKMQDDYSIQSMSISSHPEKLIVEITIKE